MYRLIIITLLITSISACTTETTEEKKRPNIVFIMTDDHAYQAISAYGSKINETPSIDRLADQGMIFNRGYVTNSICGPSRAVILTSKFSHINGFINNGSSFDGSQQTFPKLLQKSGYKTAMLGKWHLKSEPTGFDYWSVLPGQGDYYYPNFITMGERAREKGHVSDLVTDKALGWMDSVKDNDEPFAVMIQHKGPHRTWMPAIRHLNLYDGEDIPEPETLYDDYETREETAGDQEMSIKDHLTPNYDLFLKIGMGKKGDWGHGYLNSQASLMTDEEVNAWENAYRNENEAFAKANLTGKELISWKYQRYIKNYLRVVAGVDENIGRVLDYLKENNLDKNTIVVYTSDQGFYLGDHGWYDKRWMYEESFRTPLIIRYPNMIKPGEENNTLVQNLDYAPTLLDVAGVDIPEDMQGKSLVPLFSGEEPEGWRTSLYYHYYEYPGVHAVKRHYGILNDNFKLIKFYHDVDKWEFYDLSSDPNELNNQYNNPEYKSIISNLKDQLTELQVQYGDTIQAAFNPPQPVEIDHKAKGVSYELISQPENRYSRNKEVILTDGIQGVGNEYFSNFGREYIGYKENAEILLDLGSTQSISSTSVHSIQSTDKWIHLPVKVEVYAGNSKSTLKKIGEVNPENSGDKSIDTTIKVQHDALTARYVKIVIKNLTSIPENMPGAGNPAWLFLDEIIVN